jgi:Fe-Mn family superoxide dismutase
MLRPRIRASRVGASSLCQGLGVTTTRTTANGAAATFGAATRRSIHSVPRLRHDYAEGGVPNLMSPAGFSIAWTDYMTLATEKLNALTAGPSKLAPTDSRPPGPKNHADLVFPP